MQGRVPAAVHQTSSEHCTEKELIRPKGTDELEGEIAFVCLLSGFIPFRCWLLGPIFGG